MKRTDIVQTGDEVLREHAAKVPVSEITSPRIKAVIAHMKQALEAEPDGVAIAAPQIGESLQIFVVSHRAFEIQDETRYGEIKKKYQDDVYINPTITNVSKGTTSMSEGCLSVRGVYGQTKRHEKATIDAYDETGKKIHRGGSGLLAQIFQHETDHLKGILFIDHASELEELIDNE